MPPFEMTGMCSLAQSLGMVEATRKSWPEGDWTHLATNLATVAATSPMTAILFANEKTASAQCLCFLST